MSSRCRGAIHCALVLFFLFFIACGGGTRAADADEGTADADAAVVDDQPDNSDQPDQADDIADDLVPDAVDDIPDTDEPDIAPVITAISVTMNPNEAAPLVGVVTATTEPATRLRVTLESVEGESTLRYAALAKEHRLPILGLLPEHIYTVKVAAETAGGATAAYPQDFKLAVPSLPVGFPEIEHLFPRPSGERESGYLFITLGRVEGTLDGFESRVVAFDATGQVRWLHGEQLGQHGLESLSNGRFLLQSVQKILEIDMFGDTVGEWVVEGTDGGPLAVTIPGVPVFHHSVTSTAADTIITLSNEFRTFENYPTSDTDPEAPKDTVVVRGDVIVDFGRDGSILQQYHLFDMLDSLRIGYLFSNGYQWSHANHAFSVADDNSIIASVRHQSCIVKFDRATGALKWILGNHDNWAAEFQQHLLTPIGTPFAWQWYQHNPKLTSQGTILVFDNGNYKAMPFDAPVADEDNWSRAVEYRVDEEMMTVQQVWEWYPAGADRIYSQSLGDVLHLPGKDHVIVVFGGDFFEKTTNKVRIFEVTHKTPAQIVYEMRIKTSSADESGPVVSSVAFRSSLYPAGMLEE
ncbi:MAG TPA: aryl-sulfate sulfotransferase [bacterium]|nr:aryl-sulfate sulfotransferase [bacterium]